MKGDISRLTLQLKSHLPFGKGLSDGKEGG